MVPFSLTLTKQLPQLGLLAIYKVSLGEGAQRKESLWSPSLIPGHDLWDQALLPAQHLQKAAEAVKGKLLMSPVPS